MITIILFVGDLCATYFKGSHEVYNVYDFLADILFKAAMGKLYIPTAKNFLCCISLQTGVKIFGWVFLVGHLIAIADRPLRNIEWYFHCDEILLYKDDETGSRVCPDWLIIDLLVSAIAGIALSLTQICTSFLLLLGVYQKIPLYIIQWAILQLIMLIVDVILTEVYDIWIFNKIPAITEMYEYYTWKCVEAYGVFIGFSYYKSLGSSPEALI